MFKYDPNTQTGDLYLSASSIGSITCPYRGWLTAVLDKTTDNTSYSLAFGSYFHKCMEHRNEFIFRNKRNPTWEELEIGLSLVLNMLAQEERIYLGYSSETHLTMEYLYLLLKAYNDKHYLHYTPIASFNGKPVIEDSFDELLFSTEVSNFPYLEEDFFAESKFIRLSKITLNVHLRGRIDVRFGDETFCQPSDYKTTSYWESPEAFYHDNSRNVQFRWYDYVTSLDGARKGFNCDSFKVIPVLTSVKPPEDKRYKEIAKLQEVVDKYDRMRFNGERMIKSQVNAHNNAIAGIEAIETSIKNQPTFEPVFKFPDPIEFHFSDESRKEFGIHIESSIRSFIERVCSLELFNGEGLQSVPRELAVCNQGYKSRCWLTSLCNHSHTEQAAVIAAMKTKQPH